jgi:hypothetical protein
MLQTIELYHASTDAVAFTALTVTVDNIEFDIDLGTNTGRWNMCDADRCVMDAWDDDEQWDSAEKDTYILFSIPEQCYLCPVGTYQDATGQLSCDVCPAGYYGATTGLTTSTCTGLCDAGYYGSAESIRTDSTCTGECDAGYYGATAGLTTSTCTGECAAGYYGYGTYYNIYGGGSSEVSITIAVTIGDISSSDRSTSNILSVRLSGKLF